MGTDARARMIDGAVRLLATAGLQGASIGAVLDVSGAPRGSVYHHFPGGKDQLVAEALAATCETTVQLLSAQEGRTPSEITRVFLDAWRELLLRSGFRAGCGAAAVTVAADGSALQKASADVFASWQARLTTLFRDGGIEPAAASSFATLLVASTEGAVILSRAAQSIEPFDTVAAQLLEQASQPQPSPGRPLLTAVPTRR